MTGWVIEVEKKTSGVEGAGCDSDDYFSVDCSGVCVRAGKLTSPTQESNQVQPLFYNFYSYCESVVG